MLHTATTLLIHYHVASKQQQQNSVHYSTIVSVRLAMNTSLERRGVIVVSYHLTLLRGFSEIQVKSKLPATKRA